MAYRFWFWFGCARGGVGETMLPLRELWAGHEEEDDEEEGFDQIGRFNLGFLLLLHKYWCF